MRAARIAVAVAALVAAGSAPAQDLLLQLTKDGGGSFGSIQMPSVMVIGQRSLGSEIASAGLVPAGARPIWGGTIGQYGGAGTVIGYRTIQPILPPGGPLQAAGTVAALTGLVLGGPPGAVVAAGGAMAAGIGTLQNVGAGGTVAAGTVVSIPVGQRIAPRQRLN